MTLANKQLEDAQYMMKMGLGKQTVGIQSVRSIADSLRHEMPIIPQVVAEVKKDKIIQLIGIIGK